MRQKGRQEGVGDGGQKACVPALGKRKRVELLLKIKTIRRSVLDRCAPPLPSHTIRPSENSPFEDTLGEVPRRPLLVFDGWGVVSDRKRRRARIGADQENTKREITSAGHGGSSGRLINRYKSEGLYRASARGTTFKFGVCGYGSHHQLHGGCFGLSSDEGEDSEGFGLDCGTTTLGEAPPPQCRAWLCSLCGGLISGIDGEGVRFGEACEPHRSAVWGREGHSRHTLPERMGGGWACEGRSWVNSCEPCTAGRMVPRRTEGCTEIIWMEPWPTKTAPAPLSLPMYPEEVKTVITRPLWQILRPCCITS
eukprot:RCo050356